MRNLQKIFDECLEKVKALDIPIGTIDSIGWKKLDKKWGICIRHKRTNTFDIKISMICQRKIILLDDLKSIVFHEILHTCEGCTGHTKLWVNYALKIDDAYGYSVSVFKTPYEFMNHNLPILYKGVCKNCGVRCEIRDPSDWQKIQNGIKFHCVWCGENF